MKRMRRVLAGFAMITLPVWAQGPNATFKEILGGKNAPAPQNTLKLTWVGVQAESVSTVAFAVDSLPDLSIFTPYRTPGIFYHNDDSPSDWLFTVTNTEMNQVLVNLSQIPAVIAGGIQGGMISLAVYLNTGDPNNPLVFEVVLDSIVAEQALDAIEAGLTGANPGLVHLQTLETILKGS